MPQSSGSASKDDTQKPQSALEFVLVDEPTKRATGDARRRVRSHVTKLQHQRARENQTISHPRASLPFIPYSGEKAKPRRDQSKAKTGPQAKVTKAKAAPAARHAVKPASKRRHEHETKGEAHERENVDEEVVRQTPPAPFWTSWRGLETAFSKGTMSFRTFALDDSTNTVGMTLEALGLDLASVLGCYKLIVQIQSRDFEHQFCDVLIPDPKQTVWERFYKFVFTDPVLLTVALLITIRYRLECLGYRNHAKDFMQVLQLEEFLIRRINAALKQPGRAISDPMLVAVALCAAYEVKNGNPQAYHIHMKGLMQMIDMRGGLAAVGRDDPYLERMLIWHDVNTSQIVGHEGYLLHIPNSVTTKRPSSNVLTFRQPIETDGQRRSQSQSSGSDAGSSAGR